MLTSLPHVLVILSEVSVGTSSVGRCVLVVERVDVDTEKRRFNGKVTHGDFPFGIGTPTLSTCTHRMLNSCSWERERSVVRHSVFALRKAKSPQRKLAMRPGRPQSTRMDTPWISSPSPPCTGPTSWCKPSDAWGTQIITPRIPRDQGHSGAYSTKWVQSWSHFEPWMQWRSSSPLLHLSGPTQGSGLSEKDT